MISSLLTKLRTIVPERNFPCLTAISSLCLLLASGAPAGAQSESKAAKGKVQSLFYGREPLVPAPVDKEATPAAVNVPATPATPPTPAVVSPSASTSTSTSTPPSFAPVTESKKASQAAEFIFEDTPLPDLPKPSLPPPTRPVPAPAPGAPETATGSFGANSVPGTEQIPMAPHSVGSDEPFADSSLIVEQPVPPLPVPPRPKVFLPTMQAATTQLPQGVSDVKDKGIKSFKELVEPPGPEQLFRLESEAALRERMRQNARTYERLEKLPFPEDVVLTKGKYYARLWPEMCEVVEPNYVCYRRLYFQQNNLERYGWEVSFLTPFLSAGKFYWDVFFLPYHMGTEPLRCFDSNAGYCLPGDPAPFRLNPPKLSWTGLAAQAGAVTGAFFVFP